MADNKKLQKPRDFPKVEKVETFNTNRHKEDVKKKPEADALKAKSQELAERYPLNPGGVSSDIDPQPQPEKTARPKVDASRNPGGVRNLSN